ncbi:acyl-CoA N-acyltransferase [Suillus clintonianus]|uniref:acyl-CoA N-acyltransferase n=1 Tax=Suillus clintonianus TaxID=1904413 RepID=UPI001B86B995|nr:acyl-CoA N-acyltransferase [Suillus clintonianus]KAG2119295.1 acyl-CoA N-acyltransferase [Suillus clintonianus]
MSQPEISTAKQPTTHHTNFCFPVRELESERVKLTPFIPDLHADLYFQGSAAYPDLYDFIPWETFTDASDFVKKVIDSRVRPDGVALYAVIDKTRTSPSPSSSANFAGIIGYMNTSPANLSTEIGYALILPPFQRTHVTTNAIGLLLQYALDLPPHGLGLRRVQWMANSRNTKSIGAVQKLGFKLEAILRWDRIFVGSKASVTNGVKEREGDPCPGTIGTDSVLLALCWDDWESERVRVLQAMDRRS